MYDRNFGGVIWTNHALERLKERGINQGDAWATFRNPEQSRYAKAKDTWVYYRTYPAAALGASGKQRIEVVASQNEKKQWVILSVWSRSVYRRTRTTIKSSAWWDNLLEAILRRLLGWLKKP